jgi:hypothetical protein
VQIHYDEGVAIYIGPEPCLGVREDGDRVHALHFALNRDQHIHVPCGSEGRQRLPPGAARQA